MVNTYSSSECICLGDDIPFNYHWDGWLAKLELFSPEFTYRPCLYLDLDTYLLKNIDEFLEIDEFRLIRDFNHPNMGNTGVMQIPENVDAVWDCVKNAQNNGQPDANLIRQAPHKFLQDKYPGKITSHKVNTNLNASIYCFHGKPKPHESEGWAKQVWDKWTQDKR